MKFCEEINYQLERALARFLFKIHLALAKTYSNKYNINQMFLTAKEPKDLFLKANQKIVKVAWNNLVILHSLIILLLHLSFASFAVKRLFL